MKIAGPGGSRTVKAGDFFVEMMQSAVQPNEILVEIQVPVTARSIAYLRFTQKASGFAVAGVAAIVDSRSKTVRVGVTGLAPKPYRATEVEDALAGKTLTPELIAAAAQKATDGIETLNDIHASAEFRAHLGVVNTRRALELAASRA
jgi:carbon-monoxide dehydrogenase medium subunit